MDKEKQDAINVGVLCPYCLSPSYLTYGKYGNMYKCDPCGAWVSTTEQNGIVGRGRLADAQLRILRQRFESIKRRFLNSGWFKKNEFEQYVFWRGGLQTGNIYLLDVQGLRNILNPLDTFEDMKTNSPYLNNSYIKKTLKIHHYDGR